MSFWKDRLAYDIVHGGCHTMKRLVEIQSQYPSLRVKTIDVKGIVPVIQLSEHGEWIKPLEWANNHIHAIESKYREQHARLIDLGRDPSSICGKSCDAVHELESRGSGDPTELEKSKERARLAERNYCRAMDLLCRQQLGVEVTLKDTKAMAGWAKGDRAFYF